jgi:site-specific DNA-methyltransferase (adenine-specific)
VLFCYKGHRALNKKGESDVITLPRVAPQKKQHPTEKPTQLLRYLIEQSTVPGELVIDPFAGSGSTLIAAFECKRQGWGCEIDKEYFDKIVVKIDEFAMLQKG